MTTNKKINNPFITLNLPNLIDFVNSFLLKFLNFNSPLNQEELEFIYKLLEYFILLKYDIQLVKNFYKNLSFTIDEPKFESFLLNYPKNIPNKSFNQMLNAMEFSQKNILLFFYKLTNYFGFTSFHNNDPLFIIYNYNKQKFFANFPSRGEIWQCSYRKELNVIGNYKNEWIDLDWKIFNFAIIKFNVRNEEYILDLNIINIKLLSFSGTKKLFSKMIKQKGLCCKKSISSTVINYLLTNLKMYNLILRGVAQ